MNGLLATFVEALRTGRWLTRERMRLVAFGLLTAFVIGDGILATPYSFDYDLMLLAPAIAFLAANGIKCGFSPWQQTLLAALWIMPLLTRSVAQATLIPLAVPVMIIGLVFLLRRAKIRKPVATQTCGVLRTAP